MIVNVLLQLLILCYFQPAYSSSLQLSLYLIFMTGTSFKCGGGAEPTHFCCWDSWFWTLTNAQIFMFSQSTHLSTWCRNAQGKAVFNHSSATEVSIQLVLENRLAVMTDFESCPRTFRLPWANNTVKPFAYSVQDILLCCFSSVENETDIPPLARQLDSWM